MKTEEDFWACSVCRSINQRRADRCYSCHTPREVSGATLAEVAMAAPGPPKELPAAAPFQSSENRAVILTVATVLSILSGAIALWVFASIGELRLADKGIEADRLLAQRLPILAAAPALGLVALVAYAAWISRVVANLPAMGLGYSRVSPTLAFFEPLIPGFNLIAMPARMFEVLTKLEGGLLGQALLGIAVLLVATPVVVYTILLRASFFVASTFERAFLGSIGSMIISACIFVAFLIGLVVVWQIEGLCRARAAGVQPATTGA
jgi:hypothetical protein